MIKSIVRNQFLIQNYRLYLCVHVVNSKRLFIIETVSIYVDIAVIVLCWVYNFTTYNNVHLKKNIKGEDIEE